MFNKKNLRIKPSFLLAAVAAGCLMLIAWIHGGKDISKQQAFTLTVSGRERNYLAYLPRDAAEIQSLPVVIALHGGGGPMGSAQMMMDVSGWPQKAEREKFLAVFPNGTPRDPQKEVELSGNIQEWNDGSGRSHAEVKGVDDVAFINAVIDDLLVKFSVDKQRIFVTGFSNGASMTFRLGGELADRIAAIAPVAGVLSIPPPNSPVSLLYISGSQDKRPQIRTENQLSTPKNPVTTWAQALKCPDQAKISQKDSIRTMVYAPCKANSEVIAITIEGMGHVYPGADTELWEQGADNPANDIINATDEAWNFFKKHNK